MAIEIVDFPIKNGDFPVRFLYVYQRVPSTIPMENDPLSSMIYRNETW